MLRRTALATLAGCSLLFVGCRPRPELRPETDVTGLTADKVEKAIIAGGRRRGWRVKKIKPGLMTATFTKGPHVASVDITYSASGYQMKMNPRTTLVHPDGMADNKYNQWVNNLDRDIRLELDRYSDQ